MKYRTWRVTILSSALSGGLLSNDSQHSMTDINWRQLTGRERWRLT